MPQLVASATWDLCRLSWSPPLRRTLLAQLVVSATWDLCCLSWLPPLHETFGYFSYVGHVVVSATSDLLPQLIAFIFGCLSWSTPLYVRPIPFFMSPPLRLSSQNRSSPRALTYIASRQV